MAPRRNVLLLATLAIWFVAWAVWTADVLVEPVPFVVERAARRIPLCLFGAALCLGLGRVLAAANRRDARLTVPAAAIGILFCSVAFALANELIYYVIAPRWGPPDPVHIPDVAMLDGWVFLAWTLLFFALAADASSRDAALQAAVTEAAALDAQHQLLVHQAQPHFIFNTLNSIYALSLDDNAAGVRTAILSLSDYLRRSLAKPSAATTIREELDATRAYLAIEQLRFETRLIVRETLAGVDLDAAIPSLLLQPLVENSVKHGLGGTSDTVTITITAATGRGRHVLSVADNAAAESSPGAGIGLASVSRRVASWGDGSGSVEARVTKPGFVTTIDLPATP